MKRVGRVACLVMIIMKIQAPGPPWLSVKGSKISVRFVKARTGQINGSDHCARKKFPKSAKGCILCLKEDHLSRNCQTKCTCYYERFSQFFCM